MTLQVRSRSEDNPLKATKWQKIPFLVDAEELEKFLPQDIFLIACSGVVPFMEAQVSKESYLANYKSYVEALKNGNLDEALKKLTKLTVYLTLDLNTLYILETEKGKGIVRPYLPTVLLQPHYFAYSAIDGKIRSQVFGSNSITWGLMLSFPQLVGDPVSQDIKKSSLYPNFELFSKLQKWIRYETKPTSFCLKGEKVVAPIRLGANCFSWIANHPQLKTLGIDVA